MAIETVSASGAAEKSAVKCTDVRKLQGTIEFMDGLAQEGLSGIEAVARLVRRYLETPAAYKPGGIHVVYDAVRLIETQAESFTNYINSSAEEVGCNNVDENERKCGEAAFQAHETGEAS